MSRKSGTIAPKLRRQCRFSEGERQTNADAPERPSNALCVAPSSENPMNLSGSRAQRKPVAELIREWLEDQADGREAERRWKALKSGKTEAIPADEVYKRLGI